MQIKLSTLAVIMGLGLGLPQIYGLMNPAGFAARVRKFPRSLPMGVGADAAGDGVVPVLFEPGIGVGFCVRQAVMLGGFAAVGIGSCVFVQDFLAVRGLAVVFLLLAKLMVDTGRPWLDKTDWVLVNQTWAYVLVVAGIWFTIWPWHLRDLLNWATANETGARRQRDPAGVRVVRGGLGFTVFRTTRGPLEDACPAAERIQRVDTASQDAGQDAGDSRRRDR